MITSDQIRAGRAILRISQMELAERSGLSVETVKKIERMDGVPRADQATLLQIREALEVAGLEFEEPSDENDHKPAVRRSGDALVKLYFLAVRDIATESRAAFMKYLSEKNRELSGADTAKDAALITSEIQKAIYPVVQKRLEQMKKIAS